LSAGDSFLRSIFNDMEYRYRIKREVYRRELHEKHKLPVIFVHELLQCPLRQDFAQKFPEVEMASLYNSRFVVGYLIEEAVKKITGARELECHRIVETQNGKYVVAGTADAFLEEEDAILEVKYLTGMFGAPHEHHILQLQLYLYLSGKKKGELWMFSPEGALFQPVEPASEQQVAELVESHTAKNPAPKWEWECTHCLYEEWCVSSLRKVRKK
jgi:CRISPR-associated exonuclease Cas4